MGTLVARLFASAVILATVAATGAAQSHEGGVRGAVRDAAGVGPGVAVQLVEETTGLTRASVSNGSGEYFFTDVLPGTYDIKTSFAGYKRFERTGLLIRTQTFLTVDLPLEVGSISESVIVNGQAPLVETSSASFSSLVGRATLDAIPSAGRNVFFMASITPTVLPTGDSQFVRQQDQSNSSLISVGGGPRRNNSYVLDGVPIVDVVNRAVMIPSAQAVEEVRVQVSAYDAEIGRTSGGVFNVTAKSGSNAWRGNALYENRPGATLGRLFFAKQSGISNPDTYYHLYGGGVGGPIVRNRTFFWASSEGYRTLTTRSTSLVLPTDAERRGDFSQSGVTIYDPLTTRADPARPGQFIRDPFPGNRIPANRLNPVAVAMLTYVPMPVSGKSRPAVAELVDRADQLTGKIAHRWNDAITSTGLYAWYQSMEPDARFYGQPLFKNAADPGEGALVRKVNLIALNNAWTAGPHTFVQARYGFSRFLDDNRPAPFDPAALGFDPAYLNRVPLRKFPGIGVAEYGRGGSLVGDRSQEKATYYSHDVSASLSRLVGRHTLKFGGDYRLTGVRFHNLGGTGSFSFQRDFTLGPDPNAPAAATGDALATFLLGYPSSGGITIGSPIDVSLRYWSGFVQDELRVTSKLSVSAGLRYEFEQGLRERHDQITVGWAFDKPFPIQVGGTRPDGSALALTGGLLYAGLDGAPRHQGDPNPLQFAPRAGFAYAVDERTSVRGGYGLFWAPFQGIGASESGSGTPGYNQSTSYVATAGNPFIPCAGCSITNPFPAGFAQPRGNSLGRLTGVGSGVEFIDPRGHLPHFHRYSIDLQRELSPQVAVSVAYLAARGEDLGGGSSGYAINLNQLDPKYAALGTALQEQVANPFLGTPIGVGILSGPTIPRGQLLRPYPQFDYVFTTRGNVARSRYHALVFTGDRRLGSGWSARANYTWSRLKDNQFGESNFFAGGSTIQNYYDVEHEYGLSVVDTPHRFNVMTTLALPFGVSIAAVGMYESGFPVTVTQNPNNTNLLGSSQRPNIVAGVEPRLTTRPQDNYDAACGCIRWLNPAAWSLAAPFTFGNAPRTDGRVRTPMRRNWDVAIEKSHRVAGTTVSVRAEVINVFDDADLRGPNVSFGDATFGQIRDAGGFPRMLQILARVAW